MGVFFGKFSSSFDMGGFDQIKEKCCVGGIEGSRWYNGLSVGDYVFPIIDAKISVLWKMKCYAKKNINGKNEDVALFEEIKQFDPVISLDIFIKYKNFNLDMNLLNKIKKPTKGCGFYKVDYIQDEKEIEKVNFIGNERKFFIALENIDLKLNDYDIVVKIDKTGSRNIIGFYIYKDKKLSDYKDLIDLHEEKNKSKYSIRELLQFSSEENDNARNKRSFLSNLMKELDSKGYLQIDNPVSLYDNIIAGRKVAQTNKLDNNDKETSIESDNSKHSMDSWSDVENEDSNFIGRKRTDYSTFHKGTTIPMRYHKMFLENLSEEVTKGKVVKVKLHINNKIYNGSVRWPNSKDRKGVTIQLLYSEKALLELLKDKLEVSYDYIMKYMNDNNSKKPTTIPEEFEEYLDFYKGDKKDTFIVKLMNKKALNISEEDGDYIEDEIIEDIGDENTIEMNFNIKDSIDHIYNYILSKGFNYKKDLIKNLYVSLKTKPFVILSGISGTGKSKIIELFAEAIGATSVNGRFKLVPVKPDWSDATDLLGYRNIEGEFNPGVITTIAYEAMKNPSLPYFLCLDEMNLARVEYYFSDILSLMETRKFNDAGDIITNMLLGKEQIGRDEVAFNKYGDVYLPENLYIVGTVNMDETTFPFSKKVLDRANTIEFNEVDLDFSFDEVIKGGITSKVYDNTLLKSEFIKLSNCIEHKDLAKQVIEELIKINEILTPYNQHFGYRVRDEIVFYMIYATRENIIDFNIAWDFCITQKILPKISGSGSEVLETLVKLFKHFNNIKNNYSDYITDEELKDMESKCIDNEYKITNKKLLYMIRRYLRDGFTTYWQ